MTNPRPPLTDARLDRLLDRWLTEGPESVADRVPEAALLTVSTTRQKGSGGFMNRFGSDRPAARMLAGLAAVAIVAVVGFGIWRSTDVSVDPTPTPTPSSEPSASPSLDPSPTPEPSPIALVDFSYPDLGWEVSLPTNWFDDGPTGLPEPYRSFGAFGEPGGSISVALGGPDGTVQVCLGLGGGCPEITVTSLDQFGAEVFGDPVGFFTSDPMSSEIDGEPAKYFLMANLDNIGGASERYLLAMHLGRPLFIHYHETPGVQNYPWAEIRNAFRFIDPISLAMIQTDDGYAVGVPDGWIER